MEGNKGFGCSNWREEDGGCRFLIWKEISGKKITPDIVKELLSSGETAPIKGFQSRKTGKPFEAKLRLHTAEDGPPKAVLDFSYEPTNGPMT